MSEIYLTIKLFHEKLSLLNSTFVLYNSFQSKAQSIDNSINGMTN